MFGALATTPSVSAAAQDEQQDAAGVVMSEMVRISESEMALKQSVIVDADLEQTWAFFTEPSQVMRWMAPVADVDLRTGGTIRTHYDSCASIGDANTIELTIVNFVPQHLLTLQSNLDTAREAEWMNEEIYARRENLYNVIEFTPLDRDRTQITSWGLGYGDGPTWQTMFDFFIRGNEWSFGQLNRAIAGEEVWPDCAN
ncbi:SRPBCC family protein [Aurantiacibacter aquimixticola]|uniref:SRPBCC family protein n=1 Tax=Aurantiacibacter aquimixticola TaxID=1958945 RepID=UPI0014037440|nr:SRPBCC domain-containing protein [Aurantiacibacter aquimixticola]